MDRKLMLGEYVSATGVVVYFAFMLVSFIMLLVSPDPGGGWTFVAFNKIILLLLGVGAGLVLAMSLKQPALLNLLLAFSAMVLVLRFLQVASLGGRVSSDAGLDFWYLLGAFAIGAGGWLTKKELEKASAQKEGEPEETPVETEQSPAEDKEAAAQTEEKGQSES